MLIDVKDFRGFKAIEKVHVAPLTILVGENSAGKTSFLAAIRYMLDLILNSESASFNKEPFLLGAYDQIAHYRGGKSGRAPVFSFGLREECEIDAHHFMFGLDKKDELPPGSLESVFCSFEFTNEFSVPSLCKITMSYPDGEIEIRRDAERNISIKANNIEKTLSENGENSLALIPAFASKSLVYVLDNLALLLAQNRKKSTDYKFLQKIDAISARFKALRSKVRSEIYASAPVRTEPGRAYTPLDASPSPQGSHIPYLLAKLKRHNQKQWEELRSKIDKFGQDSGMFNKIDVKNLGRSESDPFQIYFDFGGPKRNIIDVGYGVSQVLPIVTSVMSAERRTRYLFQQPEVHLHPQAQAALGTFLCTEAQRGFHSFIIESHSDFIIDRMRMAIRDGLLQKEQVSVLYFSRNRLESIVSQIEFDQHGNVLEPPQNYRKFFVDEAMRSIGE